MKLDALHLATYLTKQLENLSPTQTLWVGVAGAPGSGKSTLCGQLQEQLGTEVAVVIPMDGYHYYVDELDQMADPVQARLRRGAPFTFNAEKFAADLQAAKKTGKGSFPSFDHGVGDPVEDAIMLGDSHRIVIVEGNYLLLNRSPWSHLRQVFDETWYLDIDLDTCKQRVYRRHLATGKDAATARMRVESNDGPNAESVAQESPRNATWILTAP